MRRVLSGILVGLFMVVGLNLISTAPASAALRCAGTSSLTKSDEIDKDFMVWTTVWWKTCLNKNDKVIIKLLQQRFKYRDYHLPMYCGRLGGVDFVSFNPYFSDMRGKVYNPGQKRLDCHPSDGWDEVILNYRADNVRFRYENGAPRSRTHIYIEFKDIPNYAKTDLHLRMRPLNIPFSKSKVG